MNKIHTISFCDKFIDRLAEYIDAEYIRKGKDLGRLAVVFGGKRPALFLKQALSGKIQKAFVPPKIYSIDELIRTIVAQAEPFEFSLDLDAGYLIYRLTKEIAPQILAKRETFAQFLPWSRQILAFIDQLDLEDVPLKGLHAVQFNAQIGYPVPADINALLQSIVQIREAYHRELRRSKQYSRGYCYLRAAQLVEKVGFSEHDEIIFGNFFYLHNTELKIIKSLLACNKARLFFQGDDRKWPVLKKLAKEFDCAIEPDAEPREPAFHLKLYAGFDVHSQVSIVREILKGIKDADQTVVVLPQSDNLIPLLAEITSLVKEFNVSMGYPLKRSSLYALFQALFAAQLTRKQKTYYAKDYLHVIRHPFVKNLQLSGDVAVTRILIHKIEEVLTGRIKSDLGGRLFLTLSDIECCAELFEETQGLLRNRGSAVKTAELKRVIAELHGLLFGSWEDIGNFSAFARVLEQFVGVFINKSIMDRYPLNLKIAERVLALHDELLCASFKEEPFSNEEMFKIFENRVERELVAFSGSPLKGLQVLGFFETRSLNFKNVIIMDVNEGTLPNLRIYEPLIPREVKVGLNLDRLEEEEEIQRYQFMRLISSAEQVHLIYQESRDKEKSRFVEELLWEEQKKHKHLGAGRESRGRFQVEVAPKQVRIKKTRPVIAHLKNRRYSASSVNTYIRCPLRFYYQYVLGLREEDDLLEEPENRQLGIFVHRLLDEVYRPLLGKKPQIDAAFRDRFRETLQRNFQETFERSMKSDSFLLKSVLEARLERFLDNEAAGGARAVKEVMHVEEKFYDSVKLSCGDINFVYIVDRVDRLEDGSIMIVDYKTGSIDPMPKPAEQVAQMDLDREAVKKIVKSFQIPLYLYYFSRQYQNDEINAAFYNLRTLEFQKFLDKAAAEERRQTVDIFIKALDFVLSEILDPAVCFEPDDSDPRYCATCPFFNICH